MGRHPQSQRLGRPRLKDGELAARGGDPGRPVRELGVVAPYSEGCHRRRHLTSHTHTPPEKGPDDKGMDYAETG